MELRREFFFKLRDDSNEKCGFGFDFVVKCLSLKRKLNVKLWAYGNEDYVCVREWESEWVRCVCFGREWIERRVEEE